MKTILTAVLASLVSASAFAANRCSVCLKAAPRGKTLCASCANKKARDERQARREAAKVAQEVAKKAASEANAAPAADGTLSQRLGASCQKSKVNVKGKLKGSVGSVQEGWSYSICMVDRVVETDTLPTAPAQPDTTGSDVL